MELCQTLLSTNIPLNKLNNELIRKFLENVLKLISQMSQLYVRIMLNYVTMIQCKKFETTMEIKNLGQHGRNKTYIEG